MQPSFKNLALLALACSLATSHAAAPNAVLENQGVFSAIPVGDLKTQNGLCLYLGAPDAGGLGWLADNSLCQVQGLVSERETAQRLRVAVATEAAADRISVVWRRTAHLPYLDSLVNLIVAAGWKQGDLQGLALSEIVRVLAPGGVAVVGGNAGIDAAALLAEARVIALAQAEPMACKGAWIRIVKKMNPAFDEWPHFLGNAGQTRVSRDLVVAPENEVRWVTGASWSQGGYRNDIMAGGRTFHEEREWVNSNKCQRIMVARDAYNGRELWRTNRSGYGSGGKSPDFSLCADDRCVYYSETNGLVARNAATGVLVTNYGAAHMGTVTSHGDWLITSSGAIRKDNGACVVPLKIGTYRAHHVAVGGVVYTLKEDRAAGDGVQAFKLSDGSPLWNVPVEMLKTVNVRNKGSVGLMAKGDNIYVTSGLNVVALNRANGTLRWSTPAPAEAAGARGETYVFPLADQVSLNYLVATNGEKGARLQQVFLDAGTGKALKTNHSKSGLGNRCWPTRATDRFIIAYDELFVDHKTSEELGWVRGRIRPACGIGRCMAYGLGYYGPHSCDCYVALRGSVALSCGSAVPKGAATPQLIAGSKPVAGAAAGTNDWPIYRADIGRSDAYAGVLPAKAKKLWSVKLGNAPLPQVTGAGGTLFAADPAKHRVVALAAASGLEQWSFQTEGRVSVAPTYYKGLCLFGDHAGWVYCLDAASGKLVWQMQAAREQKLMSAYDGLESAWPVKSGVLVFRDRACFSAGRCGAMDGGLDFYDVDPASGQIHSMTNFYDRRPTDIVVSDGRSAFMPNFFYSPAAGAGEKLPAPQPRVCVGNYKFGYFGAVSILYTLDNLDPEQTRTRKRGLIKAGDNGGDGDLMAFDTNLTVTTWGARVQSGPDQVICRSASSYRAPPLWVKRDTAQQMQALLLTGQRVYCAGIPQDRASREPPALWIFSNADGALLQKLPLDGAPVIDGMSAVGGRLFLTTLDGQLLCYDESH